MCTELREQPALSVARVEVNYFQRRLPGTSIKAAFCFCLSFTPRLSLSPVSPLTSGPPPPPLSLSLSLLQSLPLSRETHPRTGESTRAPATAHRDTLAVSASRLPSPVAVPHRACRRGPFTNAHDYRGFAGKALGLRAS